MDRFVYEKQIKPLKKYRNEGKHRLGSEKYCQTNFIKHSNSNVLDVCN